MKKNLFYLFLMSGVITLSSCGSSKTVAKQDVEVNIPCSGVSYNSDAEHFRANAMGMSKDLNIAKNKALAAARQNMAESISVKVKSVTDNYQSSYQMGDTEEAKSRFQNLSRIVSQQTLQGSTIICEKTMKSPDGYYKVYVALEIMSGDVLNSAIDKIKNDDKLRVDFEYEKFKKVFDEEMANFNNN